MGVQSLHGGWFRNAGVRVGRRWLPVSARRTSVLRVRLDAAGSLDQFPGHKPWVGCSLSSAHEGRLAPVHQDSHFRTAATARARTRSSGMFRKRRRGRSDCDDAVGTRGHVHFALENRGQEWGRLRLRLCLRGGGRPLPEVCGASLQLQRQRCGRENQGEEGSLTMVESSAGSRWRHGESDRAQSPT